LLSEQDNGGYVARIFKFIDISGYEMHTIDDPEDKLPIPMKKQEISIGSSTMLVESVVRLGNPGVCPVYSVRVQTAAGGPTSYS
jgi:hypothetical protein